MGLFDNLASNLIKTTTPTTDKGAVYDRIGKQISGTASALSSPFIQKGIQEKITGEFNTDPFRIKLAQLSGDSNYRVAVKNLTTALETGDPGQVRLAKKEFNRIVPGKSELKQLAGSQQKQAGIGASQLLAYQNRLDKLNIEDRKFVERFSNKQVNTVLSAVASQIKKQTGEDLPSTTESRIKSIMLELAPLTRNARVEGIQFDDKKAGQGVNGILGIINSSIPENVNEFVSQKIQDKKNRLIELNKKLNTKQGNSQQHAEEYLRIMQSMNPVTISKEIGNEFINDAFSKQSKYGAPGKQLKDWAKWVAQNNPAEREQLMSLVNELGDVVFSDYGMKMLNPKILSNGEGEMRFATDQLHKENLEDLIRAGAIDERIGRQMLKVRGSHIGRGVRAAGRGAKSIIGGVGRKLGFGD